MLATLNKIGVKIKQYPIHEDRSLPPELLEQVLRYEGDRCVLYKSDVVGYFDTTRSELQHVLVVRTLFR